MYKKMTSRLLEGLVLLEKMLDKFPEPIRSKLKKDITDLKSLLNGSRNPRLLVAGRRGSGKSSLINAFVGEKVAGVGHIKSETGKAKWYPVKNKDGDQIIELIDTRGLGEDSNPKAEDTADNPRESLLNEISEKHPDVILFTCKAKEADSRITYDLDDIEFIVEEIDRIHNYNIPIIGIITQCDELTPKNVKLQKKEDENSIDYEEKSNRVTAVEVKIHEQIEARPKLADNLIKTIGVSAYMSWRKDGSLREDDRWRIEELLSYIFDELPDEAKVEFARITKIKSFQKKISNKIILGISSVCAALAATPVPIGDLVPITSLQLSMIIMIAYVGGKKPTMENAKKFLVAIGANIGGAFVFREAARALIKYVFPGAGNAVSATIAYAATISIGKAATAYFIDGASKEVAKEIYNSTKKQEIENETGDKITNSKI